MTQSRIIRSILLCAAAVVASGQTPDKGVKSDNTKVNERDRKPGEVTADQQKVNVKDRDLTQSIRRSIMADKSLSTYAHNIKIISQNGSVTLKGPVKSDSEKKTVLAMAVGATGSADKVTDEVSVAK